MNSHTDRKIAVASTVAAICLLFGCASVENVAATETTAAAQGAGTAATSAANSRRGRVLFLQCRACHALQAADGHRVGPNLAGLFGATIGAKEDFVYSEALANSDAVWNEQNLDEFLARPNDYFPGTKMAFAGVASAADRRDLIAYLQEELSR